MITIRPYRPTDWPALWAILHATFEAGDTYAYPPGSSEAAMHNAWIELPTATWLACESVDNTAADQAAIEPGGDLATDPTSAPPVCAEGSGEIGPQLGERIVGSYTLKPNQPGLGGHVCNCSYVVAAAAQGRGIAQALCEHSQQQALALQFRAMQFNLVVASNTRAVRLWQRLGFAVVGTLPGAFAHRTLGYVDALVMYKTLAG